VSNLKKIDAIVIKQENLTKSTSKGKPHQVVIMFASALTFAKRLSMQHLVFLEVQASVKNNEATRNPCKSTHPEWIH
jgi:hypothetical protein